MRSLTLPLLSPGAKKRLFPPPPLSFHPPIRHGALNSCRSVAPAARRLALVRVDVDPGEIFWRKGNTVFPLLSWKHRGTKNRFFRLARPFARENHALATTLFSGLVARLRFSRISVATLFEPQGFEVERSEWKLAWASRKIFKKHRRRRVLTRVRVDKCSRLFFLALSSANKEDITDVSSACLIHHIAKSIVELLKVLFKKRETSEAAPKFSGKKTRHRASRSLSTPRFRISALHSERRRRAPMPLLPALVFFFF